MKKKIKIAFALGGGAALGYAHLGAIEYLKKNGIEPDIIVGTSMGSLVGGCYCAGISHKKMMHYIKDFKLSRFFDLSLFRFKVRGLSRGKGIQNILYTIFGDKKIEDLKIKYAAVATDLLSRKEVVINSGEITKAIRASISIPLVFEPVEDGERLLIDGGVQNQIPTDVARKMGADIVIGFDVTRQHKSASTHNRIFDIMENVMEICQYTIFDLKGHNHDVLIAPNLSEMSLFQFRKYKYAIQAGREAAEKMLPDILKAIANKENS